MVCIECQEYSSVIVLLAGLCHVTRIQFCDWLVCVTWLEYSSVIGWFVSRDYNTALWLTGLCHVTRIQRYDWLVWITWLEYSSLISWSRLRRDYNTGLWLAGVGHVTRIQACALLGYVMVQMTILSTEFISILPAAGWFVTFLLKIELPDHLQGKKIVK